MADSIDGHGAVPPRDLKQKLQSVLLEFTGRLAANDSGALVQVRAQRALLPNRPRPLGCSS